MGLYRLEANAARIVATIQGTRAIAVAAHYAQEARLRYHAALMAAPYSSDLLQQWNEARYLHHTLARLSGGKTIDPTTLQPDDWRALSEAINQPPDGRGG